MQVEAAMQLGELEKLLLNYLWEQGTADAKQVHDHFKKARGGSLNTIQSTLDRLHKKALLTREKHGHAYRYSAALEKQAFLGTLIRHLTEDFATDHHPLLAAFVSLSADLDEAALDRLEALIKASRQDKQEQTP
jgi:predicted transcriptional regulator